LDVIEIDAASNRGIDEIRDLRERVGFVPTQGKYKVYIIDEVHMLTTEAFNALLKTLEEPPGHVLFVLATTEPQKIPPTVMSRCQRFDFRKIMPAEMEARLQEILAALGLRTRSGVLELIIRKADGGLRDAISILDQCISFSQEEITLETAYEVLGMVKNEALSAMIQAYIDKDAPNLLVLINKMLQEGLEPGQIIKDLLEHLRSMILLLVCGPETALVVGTAGDKEILLKQAGLLGLDWLSATVTLLSRIDAESKWRQNMRIVLETTLLGLLVQAEEKKPAAAVRMEKTPAAPKPEKANAVKAEAPLPTTAAAPQADLAVKDIWDKLMLAVKEKKRTLHAVLAVSEAQEIKGSALVIVFKSGYTFHKEKIEETDNKKFLEEILEKFLGSKLQVVCRLEGEPERIEDPVQKARDLFGPEVVTIKD
jgi:DNA polymerase-3 subunit gamma/tau